MTLAAPGRAVERERIAHAHRAFGASVTRGKIVVVTDPGALAAPR